MHEKDQRCDHKVIQPKTSFKPRLLKKIMSFGGVIARPYTTTVKSSVSDMTRTHFGEEKIPIRINRCALVSTQKGVTSYHCHAKASNSFLKLTMLILLFM